MLKQVMLALMGVFTLTQAIEGDYMDFSMRRHKLTEDGEPSYFERLNRLQKKDKKDKDNKDKKDRKIDVKVELLYDYINVIDLEVGYDAHKV